MSDLDPAALRAEAERLLGAHQPSAAAALLEDALAAAPDMPPADAARLRLDLARAERARGDLEAARRALDAAAAVDGPWRAALLGDVFDLEVRALADSAALDGEAARRWTEAARARHPAGSPQAAFHDTASALLDARELLHDGAFPAARARAEALERAAADLGDVPPRWATWLRVEAVVCRGRCLLALDRVDEATAAATGVLAEIDDVDDWADVDALAVRAGAAALLADCLAGKPTSARWAARARAARARVAARGLSFEDDQHFGVRAWLEAGTRPPIGELVARVGDRLRHIEWSHLIDVERALATGWGQPVHDAIYAEAPIGFGLWRAIGERVEPVRIATVLITLATALFGVPLAAWLGVGWGWIAVGLLLTLLGAWFLPRVVLRYQVRRGAPPPPESEWWEHVAHREELHALEAAAREILGPHRTTATATLFEQFGHAYGALGDGEAAARCFDEVHRHAARIGWPEKAAEVAEWLAWLHRIGGRTHAAIFHAALAVEARQRTAAHLDRVSASDRAGFLRRHRAAFTLLADLLLARGQIIEAERVLALLKADELRTFTRAFIGAAPLALDPLEMGWLARYRAAVKALRSAERAHEAALAAHRAGAGDAETVRAAAERVEARRAAYHAERAALDDEMRRADAAAPEPELPQQDRPRDPDTADAIAAIDDATAIAPDGQWAVLKYIVTDRRLHLIARIGLGAPQHVVAPCPADAPDWPTALARRVAAVRAAVLDRRHTRDLPAARALAEVLLPAAVRRAIDGLATPTVLFALDSPLRYLPLAALPHPDDPPEAPGYLVERWAIALYTPAARAALDGRAVARWGASAFGVTRGHAGFEPLPEVGAELSAIADRLGDVTLALDDDFTEQALVDGLTSGRPVLHCATHFRLDPHRATDSGLLLGTGDLLTLQALAEDPRARYRFADLDLLTLSACQTAFGADGDGREVESLGVIAQRKGARSVLASLWKVSDEGTSALMEAFYGELAAGHGKSQALRRAQLRLLGGAVVGEGGPVRAAEAFDLFGGGQAPKEAPRRAFDVPWFWAAFVLLGRWR